MVCRTVTIEGPAETGGGTDTGGDTGGTGGGTGGTGDTGGDVGSDTGGDTGSGTGGSGGTDTTGGILQTLKENKTLAAGAGVAGLGIILATRGGDEPGRPLATFPRRTISRRPATGGTNTQQQNRRDRPSR
jgi:hypothetical protein